MVGQPIVPLSEIKSYDLVEFFCIKMMNKELFRPVVLRHSIKKSMFSVQGKLDLFKSGRGGRGGGVLPPLPPFGSAPAP